ncbi:MAG TPA: hypothetical protein PLH43_05935 [Acetivibrio sp.]|nr:hypothetical protein [Acetivibrio sp.]HOM02349.1 hypothetical protein [Acetivibrio sp.]
MDDYPADLQSSKALWVLLKSEGSVKRNNKRGDKYKRRAIVNP